MKLQELAAVKPTKQINRVFESYFGSKIAVEKIPARQAQIMLRRVQGLLSETRRQPAFHNSEKNPAYLKLVMMEQALTARLREEQPDPAQVAADVKDPKLAAALKKSAGGQTLNPEEQKLVAGAAMMKAESRLRNVMRRLNESEVQQAQVVLAAQDMVDKMQSMLEDASEMQFKELPALVDSIKNQVGIDQAQQFNTDATAALTGLVQNLQGAKAQLDQALGVVTGQTPPPDAGMADMGAAPAPDMAGGEMPAAPAPELAPPSEEPAEVPAAALGRAKR